MLVPHSSAILFESEALFVGSFDSARKKSTTLRITVGIERCKRQKSRLFFPLHK